MSSRKPADSSPAREVSGVAKAGPESGCAGEGRSLVHAHDERGAGADPRRRPRDNRPQARRRSSGSVACGARPSWRPAKRASGSGGGIWSTNRAAARSKSSLGWRGRMGCCGNSFAAWRARGLCCGGGRSDQLCRVGLHGTLLRAPLGCPDLVPAVVALLLAAPLACLTWPRRHARHGLKLRYTNEQPAGEIGLTIQGSSLHGKGHRKGAGAAAPGRRADVVSGRAAPDGPARTAGAQRQPQPVEPNRHKRTIVAGRLNQMRRIDATTGFTLRIGQVPIFAVIDHGSACSVGIRVARSGTRFEALEPLRLAMREQFSGFSQGIARGVNLPHGHGSPFMSDGSPHEMGVLEIMDSSPPFAEQSRKATASSNASSGPSEPLL